MNFIDKYKNEIYEFSAIISSVFFVLLWIPYVIKIIKEKNAKSQSLSHLIFRYLGFICNCIYSSTFKIKYTFYTYIFDISCLTIVLIYKICVKNKTKDNIIEKTEIKIDIK